MALQGKNILVTGGAGTIGRALIRYFLDSETRPANIRIVDKNAQALRAFETELHGQKPLQFFNGDICLTDVAQKSVADIDIVRQVCDELGVEIIKGTLATDHVHMFVEIPSHVSVSYFMQRAKGRSSRRIQQEFPELKRRYWGQRFWARGYFCTTGGNITNDVILNYLEQHAVPH